MTGEIALESATLPSLVKEAAAALARASTAAEVLSVRETAGAIYDAAKRAGRLQKAKAAHDELIGATYRAQADALEIESLAKRRLADEYDAAQDRGDVQKHGGDRSSKVPVGNVAPTAAEIGLSRKQVHEARQIRDVIEREPGIVRSALDQLLASRAEPSRANLRAAIGTASASKQERGNNLYETPPEAVRTLLALESFGPLIWEPACGRGAISRLLEDAGHEVILSDLVEYGTATKDGECQHVADFLLTNSDFASRATAPQGAPSGGASEKSDGGQSPARPVAVDIVTNPPYGESLNAFVAHALRVHRPRKMALLLNGIFLWGSDDADRNFALDECPPARVLAFTRRLPMMHRDGWDGEKASSRMNTAWFVWEQNADGNYAGPTVLHRVDWKNFEPKPNAPTSSRAQSGEAGAAPPPAVPASAPADLLPKDGHNTELSIGGMRKNGTGRIVFKATPEGFVWSHDLELKGVAAISAPFNVPRAEFRRCLAEALDYCRMIFDRWAADRSSTFKDRHRAAAKAAAAWCAAKLAEWELGEAEGCGDSGTAPLSVLPDISPSGGEITHGKPAPKKRKAVPA